MIEELLFKVGIPTYKTNLETEITAVKEIELGQNAPTNIGWIYGISVNCEGTSPDTSKNLITLANAKDLWVNFKIGSSVFIQTWRLSELVFTIGGTARTQPMNYQPCSIPLELDWKQSTIENPTLITGKYVVFNLWYIDVPGYNALMRSGVIWKTGNKPS